MVSLKTPSQRRITYQELTPSPVVILILNAMCILSEDRFLARSTSSPLMARPCPPVPAPEPGVAASSHASLAKGASDMNTNVNS